MDDAIVVVENIVRHRDLPENQGRSLREVAVRAVDEVGNPTILATLAVIAAIVPMGFVGGMMGPYMRPIPVGATAAMLFSLVVAFMVTPWAAVRLLGRGKAHGKAGHGGGGHGSADDRLTRAYRWVMSRFVGKTAWRWGFLIGVAGAVGRGAGPPVLRPRGPGKSALVAQDARAVGAHHVSINHLLPCTALERECVA